MLVNKSTASTLFRSIIMKNAAKFSNYRVGSSSSAVRSGPNLVRMLLEVVLTVGLGGSSRLSRIVLVVGGDGALTGDSAYILML